MKKNILDYLEEQADRNPDKIVFEEADKKITYQQFRENARQIGSSILKQGIAKGRIAVYLDKSIECLIAMFGILFSGSLYCVLDTKSPLDRVSSILETLSPELIITDAEHRDHISNCVNADGICLLLDDLRQNDADEVLVCKTLERSIDTDPAYILFTSGSTGIPKGTVVSHRSVMNYAEAVIETFALDSTTVFGNQTPFYFSMSVLDIFVTIVAGGTLVIIPKMFFSFPVKLIEFLNQHKINTIYWVPTAMCIVANRNTFEVLRPEYLTKIMFAGEVMPVKQLNYWIEFLPDCLFANLYGPTEITDTGTYYILNRTFSDDESLPIGIPFQNSEVLLLNEKDELVQRDEEGEICFRGSFLGYGYFDNWEKTSKVFCQNPLNTHYPELIYRTGDIGRYNEYGEVLYISRKDFQIKRNGYRIELGEIESNVTAISGIHNCVCIYDSDTMKIVLYYVGNIEENQVLDILEERLLKYMMPDYIFKRSSIPVNANGKYDRQLLEKEYKERV